MSLLCPIDVPRRRPLPVTAADRIPADLATAETAQGFLESFYDDAATGDADLEEAAAQEAAARLAVVVLIVRARSLLAHDARGLEAARLAADLGDLADGIADATAYA